MRSQTPDAASLIRAAFAWRNQLFDLDAAPALR
jgi:hypothetical protein